MKRDEHTAGPWHVSSMQGSLFIETATGYVIASIGRLLNYRKAHAANARLLAAAPEMLEALRLFREFFDKMPKGQFAQISCDIGIMNEMFLKSDAVLRKIRGNDG